MAGILKTISPRAIITGKTLNYKKYIAIPFSKYCQIHEYETPCNSIRTRTRGAIFMDIIGNKQGGFKFMTLGSMEKVAR